MEYSLGSGDQHLSPELLSCIAEALGPAAAGAASSDESDDEAQDISIGEHVFHITTAEDDFNKDKITLFATHLWTGGKVLATYLATSLADQVKGGSVLEFGAGAGLPSMLCARSVTLWLD